MFDQFDWRKILERLTVIDQLEFILKNKKDRKPIGAAKLASMVRKHRIKNNDNAFNRALGNATRRGRCPVRCNAYVGNNGEFLVIIEDSGQGFDYEALIKKFNSGQKYFQGHGKGMRVYNANRYSRVSCSGNGNTIAILYNMKA